VWVEIQHGFSSLACDPGERQPRDRSHARVHRGTAALALSTLVLVTGAQALETDQYSTWGHPLADATAPLSAKVNLEIRRALEAVAARHRNGPATCSAIARELHGRLTFEILQPIEVWANQSTLAPRLPADAASELEFRRTNLNGNHGPLDFGRWVPDSPTVEVHGVRFGTDKLSHFFSSGWRYYRRYVKARRRGLSDEQARNVAIHEGILEERTTNGLLTDGVFSPADLEANYQGMLFYLNLCDGPDPLLELEGGAWKVHRLFDWGEAVSPAWDESFNVSIYSPSRWRKVRPRLLEYCARRSDPDVVRRLNCYRLAYLPTPSEAAVAQLVRQGTLPDPYFFTLGANCPSIAVGELPTGDTLSEVTPPAAAGRRVPAFSPDDQAALMHEIAARDANRESRVYTLASVHISSPQRVAGSLGWFVTRVPVEFDCHTICDLRGLVAEIEPGLAGGQLSAGYARIFGETGQHERFLSSPYLGLGVRATALHTWGDGPLAPGLTFLGVEGEFTITSVNFRLGTSWRIGGAGPTHDRLISWSFGWGF
jgi:hypothetical protein